MLLASVISFVFIVFVCVYFWSKARRQLTSQQKALDIREANKQDLWGVCILFAGYVAIAMLPSKYTLYLYLLVALIIGAVLQFFSHKRLTSFAFPLAYTQQALIYSTISYLNNTMLGLLVLLLLY